MLLPAVRRSLPFVLLVSVLLAGAAPAQTAVSTPVAPAARQENPPEQIDAYVALIQADQARDRGNWKTAIQHYREAMKQYAMLVEKFPTWNPEIVQFRLTYCANEVQSILQKSGKTEAELLAGPAISVEDESASYKDRFDAVKREYEKAREELSRLRKDTALYQATAKNLELEAKRLEKDNNRLRLDLTASSNLANRNAGDVEKQRQDLTLAKAQLDETLMYLQKANREKEAAEKARGETEQQGVQLSKSLAEARRVAAEAEGRIDQAQQKFEAAQKELADREQRIASLTNELQRATDSASRLATELKATGKVDAEKLKQQLAITQAESANLAKKLEASESAVAARVADVARLSKEQRSLTNELAAARTEIDGLKKQVALAQAEAERARPALVRYADATNELARQTIELQKLERSLSGAKDEAARGREALGKFATLTNTIAQQKAEIAKIDRDREAAIQGRDTAIDAAGSALKTKAQLDEALKENGLQKAQLAQIQKELAATKDLADQTSREFKRLRGTFDDVQATRAVAEREARLNIDAVARLEKENKELQARLKGGDAGQQASAAAATELKQVREQLAAALATIDQLRKQTNAPVVAATVAPADLEKLRKELVAAQDEVRNWTARHDALGKTADGLKQRLAELNADMLARDKKASQNESDLAALRRETATAKEVLAAAQKRAADMEEQVRTLAVSRTTDLEKLRKHADALSETVDLNQKEMERLRTAVKTAEARAEQLEGEIARLKKSP